MNQSKIVEQIRNGKEERAFERLYKFYPKVEKYICINSGSKEEALDIFQEALIVLFKKIQTIDGKPSFTLEGFFD